MQFFYDQRSECSVDLTNPNCKSYYPKDRYLVDLADRTGLKESYLKRDLSTEHQMQASRKSCAPRVFNKRHVNHTHLLRKKKYLRSGLGLAPASWAHGC